ncbi:septum site-determining protein MinC [Brasilonema octagenarum]|uniref:septum site-determining protein MinC n=1 Tax=Brasilonema octagenarum TaxID=417105 RepID=UPI001B7D009E|nr:septum site-determining protein MinC [Brasilonema octagenarum]
MDDRSIPFSGNRYTTSDSTIPDQKLEKSFGEVEEISALSDLKSISQPEENPVLPEAEVNSVLLYLKSHIPDYNVQSNSNHSNVESNSFEPNIEQTNSSDSNVESNSFEPNIEQTNISDSNVEANSLEPNIEPTNSSDSNVKANSLVPDSEPDPISDTESNPSDSNVESNSVVPDVEFNPANINVELSEEFPSKTATVNPNIQVQIKSQEGKLLLILPTESQLPASEYSWTEIWQQIKLRLLAGERSFSPNTAVNLIAQDRLLDNRQLQELAESLNQFKIQLKSVSTSRRQTAIAAVTMGYSVEQLQRQTTLGSELKSETPPFAEPLYLDKTVRSGEEIRHQGHVILLGDLNPGGIVVANGDILVWGRLRGIAHAGALGNRDCLIMSLQMEPTQLRIADAVARAPEKSPLQFYPEVAYITSQGIRIARVSDFSKILLSRMIKDT